MSPSQIEHALETILQPLTAKSASLDRTTIQEALLKYANEHNLAVTQLERMAQVYNVSKAVAQGKYAAAENRGDDLGLVDVPALLQQYMEVTPKTASAAPTVAVLSPWQQFTVGTQFDTSYGTIDTKKVDKWWEEHDDQIGGFKQASEQRSGNLYRDMQTMRQSAEAELHVLEGLMHDNECAARPLIDKLASVTHTYPVESMLQDAATLAGEHVACKIATRLRLRKLLTEVPVIKAASWAEDPHRLQGTFEKLATIFENEDAMLQVHEELSKEATSAKLRTLAGLHQEDEEGAEEVTLHDDEVAKLDRSLREEAPSTVSTKDIDMHPARRVDDDDDEEHASPESADRPKVRKPQPTRPSLPAFKNPVTPAYEAPAHAAPDNADQFGADLNSILSSVGGGAEAVGGLGKRLVESLGSVDPAGAATAMAGKYEQLFGHGRDQASKRLAARLSTIRQMGVITRLMHSDPVLRDQDQGRLVSIFNTLRSTNPAIASDINLARTVLREAVQNQGFTLNTTKTLADTAQPKKQS